MPHTPPLLTACRMKFAFRSGTCPFIHPSVYPFIHLFIHLPIHPPTLPHPLICSPYSLNIYCVADPGPDRGTQLRLKWTYAPPCPDPELNQCGEVHINPGVFQEHRRGDQASLGCRAVSWRGGQPSSVGVSQAWGTEGEQGHSSEEDKTHRPAPAPVTKPLPQSGPCARRWVVKSSFHATVAPVREILWTPFFPTPLLRYWHTTYNFKVYEVMIWYTYVLGVHWGNLIYWGNLIPPSLH